MTAQAEAPGHSPRGFGLGQPVSVKEYGAILAGFSLSPEEVAFTEEVFEGLLDGTDSKATGDVQRVLGRAPRDFTDFAREHAAQGVWKV